MAGVQTVEVRIGDAEREEAAAQLREHFAAGRLTHDELDERLDTCMKARTAADLRALTLDLPPLTRQTPRPRAERGRWAAAWRHWAAVSIIVWAIWGVGLVTGSGAQGLWPVWVSGPWAAVLAGRAVRGEDPRLPHQRHVHHRHHHSCR